MGPAHAPHTLNLHVLRQALLLTTALFGCVLFFVPGVTLADDPISVNTIISRSGAQWNAPAAQETFFPAFAPNSAPKPGTHHVPLPELAPAKRINPRAPGSVIGRDGRTRVRNTQDFPNRAIVYLIVDFDVFTIECTGTLIGPHTVATAGHCIRDPGLGWATRARVYPALDRDNAPYNGANATEFYSVTGWIESYQPEFDYGAIQLDRNIGNDTGWLGMSVMDKLQLIRTTVRVTGYPADKPAHTMWTMAGPVRRVTPLRIFYAIDTYGGQSGSPVFQSTPTRACMYCIVGIHGYGVGADPRDVYNSGVRITPAVLSNFVSWRKLP